MPTYSNTGRREKRIHLPNTTTVCNYVESLAGHNKDLTETDESPIRYLQIALTLPVGDRFLYLPS